jgi:hypothetical protein
MPTGFDEAFRAVKELVATFRNNERFYLSSDYQEAEARRDFIDKFWIALGWEAKMKILIGALAKIGRKSCENELELVRTHSC